MSYNIIAFNPQPSLWTASLILASLTAPQVLARPIVRFYESPPQQPTNLNHKIVKVLEDTTTFQGFLEENNLQEQERIARYNTEKLSVYERIRKMNPNFGDIIGGDPLDNSKGESLDSNEL